MELIPQLPIIPDLEQSPTFHEIFVAMKGLKNNKAAGPDGLPAEVFKHGGYHLLHRLHTVSSPAPGPRAAYHSSGKMLIL